MAAKSLQMKTVVPARIVVGDGSSSRLKEAVRCYQGNEMGHYAKNCPTKKERPKKTSVSQKTKTGNGKVDRQVGLVDDNNRRMTGEDSIR